jgi:uncharacterized repeat protein (TIGR03803 family)
VFDQVGNLYGATTDGGANDCPGIAQCGTVYQLQPPVQKGKPWTENLLYVFKGVNSNDGNTPAGGVILDQAGHLYGTTAYGGTGKCQLFGSRVGCGTVFQLVPPKQKGGKWTEKILHSFQSGKDGYFPWGDLTFDSAGNLYGATQYGGGKGTTCDSFYQFCGTVFQLIPPKTKAGKWTEKVLHSFAGGSDGANPNGGLVLDSRGAIYGTTFFGGSTTNCKGDAGVGCGTVFRIKPPPLQKGGSSTETLLHVFTDGNDGAGPNGGLVFNSKGFLYGTAGGGGAHLDGVVFRLNRAKAGRWAEKVVYAFEGGRDGDGPNCCLVFDGLGNLYGTAFGGLPGRGTVFQLRPKAGNKEWIFSLRYAFLGAPDAAYPTAGLIFDKDGNVYSTTQGGGTGTVCSGGCGTVFEVEP